MVKVSVVVCTYNRCASLRDTLRALKGQRVDGELSFEVVVVDNNSTDETRQTVDEARRQTRWPVRYVFEQKQGLSHARNVGIREAKSDLVMFTDDDVVPDERWVDTIVRAFESHEADCVGGRILPIWSREPANWLTSPDYWAVLALLDHGPKPIVAESINGNFLNGRPPDYH